MGTCILKGRRLLTKNEAYNTIEYAAHFNSSNTDAWSVPGHIHEGRQFLTRLSENDGWFSAVTSNIV